MPGEEKSGGVFSGTRERFIHRGLWWNGGGIRINNPNDVRKRILFDIVKDFDVEVKSWASEIGRVYYSKTNYMKSSDF